MNSSCHFMWICVGVCCSSMHKQAKNEMLWFEQKLTICNLIPLTEVTVYKILMCVFYIVRINIMLKWGKKHKSLYRLTKYLKQIKLLQNNQRMLTNLKLWFLVSGFVGTPFLQEKSNNKWKFSEKEISNSRIVECV